MFSTSMMDLIFWQTNITLAITKHIYMFLQNTQVIDQTMHPNSLFNSFCYCHILCFSGRQCNSRQKCWMPTNSSTSYTRQITTNWSLLINLHFSLRSNWHIINIQDQIDKQTTQLSNWLWVYLCSTMKWSKFIYHWRGDCFSLYKDFFNLHYSKTNSLCRIYFFFQISMQENNFYIKLSKLKIKLSDQNQQNLNGWRYSQFLKVWFPKNKF